MAKWTLPEGKIYTQADLDAAVAAALREAAAKASAMSDNFDELGHVDHAVAAHDVSQAILSMIDADAGAALDRALAAERERLATWLEGTISDDAHPDSLVAFVLKDRAAAIRAQGKES